MYDTQRIVESRTVSGIVQGVDPPQDVLLLEAVGQFDLEHGMFAECDDADVRLGGTDLKALDNFLSEWFDLPVAFLLDAARCVDGEDQVDKLFACFYNNNK